MVITNVLIRVCRSVIQVGFLELIPSPEAGNVLHTLSKSNRTRSRGKKKNDRLCLQILLVADSLAQSLQINYDATNLQRSKALYSG